MHEIYALCVAGRRSHEPLEQRSPAHTEDPLARPLAIDGETSLAQTGRKARIVEELPRPRRVRRDEWAPARQRLERLVRDHACSLLPDTEDPERTPGRVVGGGEARVLDPWHPLDIRSPGGERRLQLPAPDDPERDLRRQSCSGENRLQPVQRNELADEERVERACRGGAGGGETI